MGRHGESTSTAELLTQLQSDRERLRLLFAELARTQRAIEQSLAAFHETSEFLKRSN
jgi:hypothetical protein